MRRLMWLQMCLLRLMCLLFQKILPKLTQVAPKLAVHARQIRNVTQDFALKPPLAKLAANCARPPVMPDSNAHK